MKFAPAVVKLGRRLTTENVIFILRRPAGCRLTFISFCLGLARLVLRISLSKTGKRRQEPGWKLVPALVFLIGAPILSWTGVAALGRHWRIDAGLNPDHQLVRSGPYSIVRHPIYASMLCMLLGTGLILTPWPLFVAAILIFLVGTEIRVRIEDGLLASQFGEDFTAYKHKVPAYIPSLR